MTGLQKFGQKFGKRTFNVPAGAVGLALVNEASKLGYTFPLMCLMVGATLVWAAIETWRDVSLMKAGLWHDPSKKG